MCLHRSDPLGGGCGCGVSQKGRGLGALLGALESLFPMPRLTTALALLRNFLAKTSFRTVSKTRSAFSQPQRSLNNVTFLQVRERSRRKPLGCLSWSSCTFSVRFEPGGYQAARARAVLSWAWSSVKISYQPLSRTNHTGFSGKLKPSRARARRKLRSSSWAMYSQCPWPRPSQMTRYESSSSSCGKRKLKHSAPCRTAPVSFVASTIRWMRR
mmetsp:Transcript_39410/g.125285  ORF Transcript_39410/g.125285 Transcript_39410/m.125285 type:complete len:213 (-) Transcript_39410:51-689(-)